MSSNKLKVTIEYSDIDLISFTAGYIGASGWKEKDKETKKMLKNLSIKLLSLRDKIMEEALKR